MTYHKKKCEGSSMDWARSMIDIAPDGAIFLADEYTVARGQHGREWKLYPGQLILTLLLKPTLLGESVKKLHEGIAVAIANTLVEYGDVKIKQPNDFFLNGKKLGGMLTEAVWSGPKLKGIVIGIAINCNNSFHKKDEMFPIATSVFDATGKKIEISVLRDQLLSQIDKWYKAWLSFARIVIT